MRKVIEYIVNLKKPGIAISIFLIPLTVLSLIFRFIVVSRTLLYRKSVFKSFRLPCRVVVVGNITTGGTGKTPMVICLANIFVRQGAKVVVLTRGYGGNKKSGVVVISDGKDILETPEMVGDEAFMIASKLKNIPVVCSKDRVSGGSAACDMFNPDIIILDDGFQHLRLKRDLDIVLVNATDPFGNGYMLPRGKLREPVKSLKRADVVVVTKTNLSKENPEAVAQEIAGYCDNNTSLFFSDLMPSGLRDSATGERIGFDELEGKKIVALCSIGDPESFFAVLEKIGINVIEKLSFPDHYLYKKIDYTNICKRAVNADLIVTTEKDIAKIDVNMIEKKVVVLETEVVIDRLKDFIALFKQQVFLE